MWLPLDRWFRNARHLLGGRERDQRLDDEIRFHVAQEVQLRIDRGESAAAAMAAVRRQFGSVTHVKETIRAVWVPTSVEQLFQDVRLGCRILTQSPGLSAIVAMLLALVIGGNTTLFSVAHGLMTKPAPGVHATRLFRVQLRRQSQPQDADRCCASFAEFKDYASQTRTVRLIAEQRERMTATFEDGSYAVMAALVSPDYFETLGVTVTHGRTLRDQEKAASASELGVVVSDRVWREYLHGVSDPVGRALLVNGHAATILGIAPPLFQGDALGEPTALWVALEPYARFAAQEPALTDRSNRSIGVIGQLVEGVSLSAAQADLDVISRRIGAAYPDTSGDRRAVLTPYSALLPGTGITDRGPILLAILGIVTILTVILVCANVANLMLSRILYRLRDVAIRKSLGASRRRVVRMLFVEGLVISAIAWLAACVFALWLSGIVGRAVPPAMTQGQQLILDVTPDWKVMAYAMAAAVFAAMAFTVAPAMMAWKQDPVGFLKAGGHGAIEERSKISRVLVIVQLALSVVLLTSAGLAYRSLSLVRTLDLGFDANDLIVVTLNTAGAAASKDTNRILLDRLREQLAAIQGVRSVSFRVTAPAESVRTTYDAQPARAETLRVSRDFLRTFGITPLAGHGLGEVAGDDDGVVVTESLSHTLWAGEPAIGRTLLLGAERSPRTVAGVVPNSYVTGVRTGGPPQLLFRTLDRNSSEPGTVTFYVRHAGAVRAVAPAISMALRTAEPRVSTLYMRTMATDFDGQLWPGRFLTVILGIFAAMSLLVAIVGQYAVLAFSVRRRTREFGVRMALGASADQIVKFVMRGGLRWGAAGLVVGFVLSGLLGLLFRRVLFGVAPTDVRTYVAVLCLIGSLSLLASYVPARRVGRIEPIDAIREE